MSRAALRDDDAVGRAGSICADTTSGRLAIRGASARLSMSPDFHGPCWWRWKFGPFGWRRWSVAARRDAKQFGQLRVPDVPGGGQFLELHRFLGGKVVLLRCEPGCETQPSVVAATHGVGTHAPPGALTSSVALANRDLPASASRAPRAAGRFAPVRHGSRFTPSISIRV